MYNGMEEDNKNTNILFGKSTLLSNIQQWRVWGYTKFP